MSFFTRINMITLSNIENTKSMISNSCETDQLCFKFTKFDLVSNRAWNFGKPSLMTQFINFLTSTLKGNLLKFLYKLKMIMQALNTFLF